MRYAPLGFKTQAPVHSVKPYPHRSSVFAPWAFKNSSISRLKSGSIISPPLTAHVRCDKPFRRSFVFNNASYKVGTPIKKLGLYFFNKLPNFLGLKSGTKTIFIPIYKPVWIDTPRPNPWNIGNIAKLDPPGFAKSVVIATWSCIAKALKFKLDKTIPLGSPVVPPLYRITASS